MNKLNAFTMWENSIIFCDGRYYYLDGKGGASLISKECAIEVEANYYAYQARMDVDRGGMHPERAYPGRGFSKDEDGRWKYTCPSEVEKLAGESKVSPIEGEFTIPSSVKISQDINQIRKKAFMGCSLLSRINIPETVQIIESEAFAGCDNLEKIVFTEKVQVIEEKAFLDTAFFRDENNWTYDALYLNGWLIKVRENAQGSFVVQDGTVGIANSAFCNCDKLTDILIPDSVKNIGSFAFKGCKSLLRIEFPKEVKKFGISVLSECTSLKHITLPAGIEDLSAMVANNTQLVSIKIPEGVTKIGSATFKNCTNLMEIELPDSITSISDTAFENTGYVNEKSNWEDGVLYLGKWLLMADDSVCGNYSIKDGTVGIADYAFGQFIKISCPDLTGLNIPDTVKYIGSSAFKRCVKLADVNVPDSVEHISDSIFRECNSLTQIRIPASVKTMDKWVFYRNMNLERLMIDNPNLKIDGAAIVNCPKLTIYAPEGSTAQEYAIKENIPFSSKY